MSVADDIAEQQIDTATVTAIAFFAFPVLRVNLCGLATARQRSVARNARRHVDNLTDAMSVNIEDYPDSTDANSVSDRETQAYCCVGDAQCDHVRPGRRCHLPNARDNHNYVSWYAQDAH